MDAFHAHHARTRKAPTHAQIAEAAYFLWLEEGRPEGRALQHWLKAEFHLHWALVRPPFHREGGHRG